ncbi:hypothetical protein sscle_10g077750 [Sclerotinia sclerotiorum 1980 UF-70]|uniref:Uncharacterized protein n=1 Tax=Sclerotinia sclerotiorum (strain ATCC 18683 / 1980 / Ss-1) TaxID=665079 RepID=A0A1D9QDH5_SCLS1|nr:hypothetical protein sscle_10g077750 [Sclerotinia sclerotiorum 1980 UF-70]
MAHVHDMFTGVQFYHLLTTLHDRKDDEAVQILKSWCLSIVPESKSLTDEMVLPTTGAQWWSPA